MSAETVINQLKNFPDVLVVGCNMYPGSWTPASRLVEKFFQVSSTEDPAEYLSDLSYIVNSESITHIVALTDPEIDILSSNKYLFESFGVCLCIPSVESVRKSRDKLEVYNSFKNHPTINPIKTYEAKDFRNHQLFFPLIAKKRFGRSSEGQFIIKNNTALDFWLAQIPVENYILQPFIEGAVMVVDIVRDNLHGSAVSITRQELLRTSNGAGMTVRIMPNHLCDAKAVEVAESLGLNGCVNIEFLLSGENIFLMDINPRFSAGVGFSVMAGYDMVSNHLRCFLGKNIDFSCNPSEQVFSRGFVEHLIKN